MRKIATPERSLLIFPAANFLYYVFHSHCARGDRVCNILIHAQIADSHIKGAFTPYYSTLSTNSLYRYSHPMATAHRRTTGFAICIHTCVGGGCKNHAKSVFWVKEGSPLRKHAVNVKKHPHCTHTCPGHSILGKEGGSFVFSTNANPDEEVIVSGEETRSATPGSNSSPASGTPEPTPYSANPSFIDLDDPQVGIAFLQPRRPAAKHRQFKIIYIPDPTRIMSRSRAESDLSFLKTTISAHEYDCVKHLEGAVHFVSMRRQLSTVAVFMQEWVSKCSYYL